MSIPIQNGSATLLSQNPGTLPNVSDTMESYYQNITIQLLTKSVVNFQVVETSIPYSFQGVWQPLKPKELEQYPEGQRAWEWVTLHTPVGVEMKDDDIVVYGTKYYRVMGKLNYASYGYFEYHLVEDYQS